MRKGRGAGRIRGWKRGQPTGRPSAGCGTAGNAVRYTGEVAAAEREDGHMQAAGQNGRQVVCEAARTAERIGLLRRKKTAKKIAQPRCNNSWHSRPLGSLASQVFFGKGGALAPFLITILPAAFAPFRSPIHLGSQGSHELECGTDANAH